MAKITDYTAVARFNPGDVILLDGSAGTRKMMAADAAIEFAGLISPINHRNIYRGKNLGSTVTAEQKAAIQNGTFDNLFIGDYWAINGVIWAIADMDYWHGTGYPEFTKHHLVMVPAGTLYNAKMNETNTANGGYVGSLMYTEGLESAKATISVTFGGTLLTHRERLINAVTDGYPSAGAWFDSSVELMNEIMIFGCPICTPAGDGSKMVDRYTIDKQQLALFALNPRAINIHEAYWLRDIASSSGFVAANDDGGVVPVDASLSLGIRPVFPIG